MPNGSYGLDLLGLIYERQQRFNEAKESFSKALDVNPSLWCAFEKLAKMGDVTIVPERIFNDSKFRGYQ